MPTVWFALKRSMHCKSGSTDVHDPTKSRKKHLRTILTKKVARSGCSRSIANLKDVVIHGSKRHLDRPPSCSPRSIGSSDFLNPITHEVILSNSRCELKISSFAGCQDGSGGGGRFGSDSDGSSGGSMFVGTLRPGTPGPGGNIANSMQHFSSQYTRSSSCVTPSRKAAFLVSENEGCVLGGGVQLSQHRGSFGAESNLASASIACPKCGEKFSRWEAVEAHHLSQHAVTELVEGDSSRKIVEIICRTSYLKAENPCGRIEKVLKVHNMQKTLARFEEYREAVKSKASKLPKKHPRCLADGNELLRFYGTTVLCSLGINGCSSLCVADKCCVCRIIRNGFSTKKEFKDGVGVFTTSTSGRAFEMIETIKDNDASTRKALIVCRVIAGRVHKPLENIQEMVGQSGFDSLSGKVGLYSNIEELYLLNPKALLPCFVVICKS